mgnify:CR=1 FL=1
MEPFFAELLVPFSYNYMLKAMWVSALVGGVCAFLSAYLMLKGWSLMGDAVSHATSRRTTSFSNFDGVPYGRD